MFYLVEIAYGEMSRNHHFPKIKHDWGMVIIMRNMIAAI
jgi:hypothetical protein